MKLRIKFDNTQLNLGYDGKLQSRENVPSQGQPALFEIDLDSLGKLHSFFPGIFPGKIAKQKTKNAEQRFYEKYKTYEDGAGILRLMPANGHDAYNYLARLGVANFQIQVALKFDGKLDPEKLKKAVRLSVDAEPVFGCQFIESDPPYWKRYDNIDEVEFCSFENTENMDESIQNFLDSPFSMDNDPKVKLKLISSESNDALCVKINHTCCDGTGTKEYLQLLANIYSCMDKDIPYDPKPSLRSRKDQDRLFNFLGIKDPETAWKTEGNIPELLWTFPWKKGEPAVAKVAVCTISEDDFKKINNYAKANNVGINSLLLTAFYRTMFDISEPQYGVPMHIPMTVDLRRYLPNMKASIIRNFSGGVDSKLERVENESFKSTLSRVIEMMEEIKKEQPGLQSAVGLERVENGNFYDTLNFYRDASRKLDYENEFGPVLSNLSYISKSLLKFGDIYVKDAFVVPPALIAPGLLLCVSTYNGKMTLTVNYYEEQLSHENMVMFLNLIKSELVESCSK